MDASKNPLNAPVAPRAQKQTYLLWKPVPLSSPSVLFCDYACELHLLTYKLAGSAAIFVFFTMAFPFDFFLT